MALTQAKFALNPLQYFATADGWLDPSLAPPLEARLEQIASAGFTAVHSEVPASMTTETYGSLLTRYGLQPGPGYVGIRWSEDPEVRKQSLERASKKAQENAALGNPLLFLAVAMTADAPRVAHPAVGFDASTERLSLVRDYLAQAAELIVSEGAVPALHPHVGTWVETADEARFVLDSVDPAILKFGPDAGHFAWTGVDPAAVITEYADRVAGVHIKDYRADIAQRGREEGWDYRKSSRAGIWTELGTGDMDMDALANSLPADFDGWIVVEVDRGTTPTPQESINICGDWVKSAARLLPA
ncbi:sugar phosphate isomerase/epimerase family protein [Paenarthrobacter sp. NCHU4564]|uniref:sugar phosphate isomerase/epimerase family protein n=1 Tax=Paenarthrobacter sp. NCHU4564 TaxID=3451353 RepID=UPI003F9503F9